MPKRLRFTRKEVESVLKQRSRRVHGALFSVVAIDSQKGAASKHGCVVSKKVAKLAVDRNRIRRRCYSVLRALTRTKDMSLTILWFAKKEVQKASFREVEADITLLLKRLHT